MRWTVLVRPEGDRGQLTLRAGERTWIVHNDPGHESAEPLVVTFEGDTATELTIEDPVAQPRVFGVIIESVEPGVVVDTLGVNGARVQTPLAWAEQPWVSAVASRAPDLVVLAYGTNEVFDALAPERYRPMYEALLARIRRAAPATACWLVGPTDVGRGGRQADGRVVQIEGVQREIAQQSGCLYFSAAGAMGGMDGFEHWLRESPPLAVNDGVHLAQAGYQRLGDQMANALIEGYESYCERARRAANSR